MKKYSDSYLQQLWRKAVKAHWGERCVKCGGTPVEIHHIVKRKRAMLRNDWKNGLPLCHSCHNDIDTMKGKMWLDEHIGYNHRLYLAERDTDIKQYLVDNGITRREFDARTVEELKRKIQEGEYGAEQI